jgi:hypothetical protein
MGKQVSYRSSESIMEEYGAQDVRWEAAVEKRAEDAVEERYVYVESGSMLSEK